MYKMVMFWFFVYVSYVVSMQPTKNIFPLLSLSIKQQRIENKENYTLVNILI